MLGRVRRRAGDGRFVRADYRSRGEPGQERDGVFCLTRRLSGHQRARRRRSYIIASDQRLDLALLWADGRPAGEAAVVARAPPQSGEDVFTLGYGVIATKPLQPVLVEGSLVGDSTARPGNRIMVIRAKLHAGNSGGAVLSGDGSLLGMIIGRDEEHAELGVALPREDIQTLLSAYGITLPTGAFAGDARNLLSAISVLIQCSSSSN